MKCKKCNDDMCRFAERELVTSGVAIWWCRMCGTIATQCVVPGLPNIPVGIGWRYPKLLRATLGQLLKATRTRRSKAAVGG